MGIDKDLFGPENDEEKEIFALEALVFSVQVALQRAMNRHGVSHKELAERLGMSPGRVSQIFSESGPNLTLKTIAKLQVALGEDFEFVRKEDVRASKPTERRTFSLYDFKRSESVWREIEPSNNNRKSNLMAA